MGALQDGVNWTLHTAERTGEGLSQIFNGLSSTSDFNSTYLPVFAAGLAGIAVIGLAANGKNIKDMLVDIKNHPIEMLKAGGWGVLRTGALAGAVMFAMGTIAEYAKTGDLVGSAQTTAVDSWHIIASVMEHTKTMLYDPAVPNPSVESVPVVRAPSSLSP
jgi:hypothetical protein